MYKIFPGTFTSDNRKVPIKEAKGWKEIATNDPKQIEEWNKLYGHKIKFWGIPTGSSNGLLVLDVDVKNNGLETVKKYHIPLTMSQRTKSGGIHYVFRYPSNGKLYANKVGIDEGLDIRGENGYIAFYGFDSTPIADAPDWLLEMAEKSEKEKIDVTNAIKVDPTIVEVIINEACEAIRSAPEGESNNVLNVQSYKIGQLIASQSIDENEAFIRLFEAAKFRGKPDYEATATIKSGFKGGGENPHTCPFGNSAPILTIEQTESKIERWTPKFYSRADLTNMNNLRKPQIFKDWSTEDITITTADGGTGKTTLKLCEAIALALGQDFLGFENKQEGRTLFITGEDTWEKIGAMLGAILKQMKLLDDKEVVAKVMNSILVKKDDDLCLITKDKQGFYHPNMEAFNKLMEAVEDIKPKLIIFDPISSFWGSESALNDMAKAVSKFLGKLVKASGACVEVINHMGKASSKDKDMTQFAGRGGTGLPSHARVSRVLRPVFDEEFEEFTGRQLEDGQSAMLCNVNKFSDGSPLYNKPFLIVREGYIFSRVTLIEQKVQEEQEKMTDTERVITFIRNERSEKRFPTKNIIIAHFMANSQKLSKDRVVRAIEYLKYMGHMGEKIKMIENPDAEMREKVYIVVDNRGREL